MVLRFPVVPLHACQCTQGASKAMGPDLSCRVLTGKSLRVGMDSLGRDRLHVFCEGWKAKFAGTRGRRVTKESDASRFGALRDTVELPWPDRPQTDQLVQFFLPEGVLQRLQRLNRFSRPGKSGPSCSLPAPPGSALAYSKRPRQDTKSTITDMTVKHREHCHALHGIPQSVDNHHDHGTFGAANVRRIWLRHVGSSLRKRSFGRIYRPFRQ